MSTPTPSAQNEIERCPFCGKQPKLTSRPDNIQQTEFVGIISCFCDGYSACAHKMAVRPTQAEADAAVIEAWNTRAAPLPSGSEAVQAVSREFTNELGNSIRITIEGPTSISENILTPTEADNLRDALNEHSQKLRWCSACGEGFTNFCRSKSGACPMLTSPPQAPSEAVQAEPLQDFESPRAKRLMAAWQEGWAACRDAEFVGEEYENDRFNHSSTLDHCIAEDVIHATPPQAPMAQAQAAELLDPDNPTEDQKQECLAAARAWARRMNLQTEGIDEGVLGFDAGVKWGIQKAQRSTSSVRQYGLEDGLHPATADLVSRFAWALADKLAAAEKKYGYSDGWASPDWMDECRQHLREHIEKGDPRDVAAYCAFLWHHGESTANPGPKVPTDEALLALVPWEVDTSDATEEAIDRRLTLKFARSVLALATHPSSEAAGAQWTELTTLQLLAIESGDMSEELWLYAPTISSKPLIGRYEWQQGRNPHGFNTEGAGRIGVGYVTHVMPFIPPTTPTQRKNKSGDLPNP